jgi:hypothetical protein
MRVVAPLWLAMLLAASLAPDSLKQQLGTKGPGHLAAHFLAFALTGIILCWNSLNLVSRLSRAIIGCGVALLLEILEALFYRNAVEWRDVAAGCLGVAFGFAVTTATANKTPAGLVGK